MVTVLALLGVLGVLFAAAVLATRDDALLADAPQDVADLALPDEPLQPSHVGRLRFSLAPRGYRMEEVDLALERLAAELADRDRRIGLLEAAARGAEQESAAAPVHEAGPEDLPVVTEPAPPLPATPEPAPEPAPEQAPVIAPAPAVGSAPVQPLPPVERAPAAPAAATPPPAEPAAPVEPAPTAATLPPASPVEALPAPAPESSAPEPSAPWSSPASVPEFPVIDAPESFTEAPAAPDPSIAEVPSEPAPLPPADLGAELLTEELLERASHDQAASDGESHDRPQ